MTTGTACSSAALRGRLAGRRSRHPRWRRRRRPRSGCRSASPPWLNPVPQPLDGRPYRRLHGPATDAEAYVDGLAAAWEGRAPGIIPVAINDPLGPAEGLSRYLEQAAAGLLAVNTHGRTASQAPFSTARSPPSSPSTPPRAGRPPSAGLTTAALGYRNPPGSGRPAGGTMVTGRSE